MSETTSDLVLRIVVNSLLHVNISIIPRLKKQYTISIAFFTFSSLFHETTKTTKTALTEKACGCEGAGGWLVHIRRDIVLVR